MKFRILMVLACAITMSGCALTEDVVKISYKPTGGPQIGTNIKVTTATVDGRTADRTRVSAKMNGFGMEMAAIRADRDVTAIINDALKAELKSRGYAVEPGGRTVTVTVNRFFSNYKMGAFTADAVADVQLGVAVTAPDGAAVYQRDIKVEGHNDNVMIATGSNAATALSAGMTNAFAALFADEAFTTALKMPAAPAAAPAAAAPAPASNS